MLSSLRSAVSALMTYTWLVGLLRSPGSTHEERPAYAGRNQKPIPSIT